MTIAFAFGWRHLLFANWPVDSDVIAPFLPESLAVDEYRGDAWVSAVALEFVDARPRGLPPWLGIGLPAVNLRTYVTADGESGVYFFSLDVPSLLTVLGGRFSHKLPYVYASVDFDVDSSGIEVRSQRRHPGARPARFAATCEPTGDGFAPTPDSLSEFLVERYRLYTESQDGRLYHTDVSHPSWRLYEATAAVDASDLFRAASLPRPGTSPRCYYSPGVDVRTTGSRRWEPASAHATVREYASR